MRIQTETVINVPRDRVIELFEDFENLQHWQEGLISYEHLSDEVGQPGSQTRFLYKMGKNYVEMTFTVLKRDIPDELAGVYDSPGVHNVIHNFFYAAGDATRWVIDSEFRFSGYMRLLCLFIRGNLRQQLHKTVMAFKAFAEAA